MGKLHHVPAESCTSSTAQTAGMARFAALAADTVGSRAIWMGETHVAPRAVSGPHHHGESETGIYILSGTPEFIYSDNGQEVRLRTKPGDYIYVPPFVHHIESNAHSDEEAVVVIARTTQEAIVENLEAL
ncbi:MAG TPA: cupin domain-containing protein [Candidatus Polarisedimenticolia bacterium]|nr:cupin domain-containing protein [Candidatus Polarisedimenticolia bacterium]